MGVYGNLLESVKMTDKLNETGYKVCNKKIDGIPIGIAEEGNIETEILDNLGKDLPIINQRLKYHIINDFIPWLKGNNNTMDDKTIMKQIKLVTVDYSYHRYIEKYSPTGKTDKFGSFDFVFEAKEKGNEVYKELMNQPAGMKIIVYNKTTKLEHCYDV